MAGDETLTAGATEMSCNQAAFPSYSFPHRPLPTDAAVVQRHHLFQEYGLYEAVDLRDGPDGVVTMARKYHGTDRARHHVLYAPEPTLPLLPPNQACSIQDVDQQDVVKHLFLAQPAGHGKRPVSCTRVQDQINYLYQHHTDIMFDTSSQLLWQFFVDTPAKEYSKVVNTLHSRGAGIPVRMSYVQRCASDFSTLLDDVLSDIPRELLENYINEDLTLWRERLVADSAYTGGSLCFQELCSTPHSCKGAILYPSSPSLDVLNVGTLSVNYQADHTVIPENTEVVLNTDTQHFSLKGRILQCESVKVQKQNMFAVRSNYHCTTLSFDPTDGDQGKAKVLQTLEFDKSPTSVALSPYIAGEVVVSTEMGSSYLLWSNGRLQQVVPDQDSTLNFVSDNPQRNCHFGSHPRLLVYSDSTGVDLKDVRAAPQNNRRPLFSLPSRWTMKGERVMFSRVCPTNYFQHIIAMKQSLVVVDERFPQNVLVKWNHMLRLPPVFMDISSHTTHDSNSHVILLANQRPQETTCFRYVNEGSCPPVSVTQPFSASKVSSWLPCLSPWQRKSNGLLERRVRKPLTGMCSVRHNSNLSGFTVLQMTSMGDMFYQSFVPDDRTDVTAGRKTASGPISLSQSSMERCLAWVDQVTAQSQDPGVCYPGLTRVQYKDMAKAKPMERKRFRGLVRMRNATTLMKAFTAPTSTHPDCCLCKPHSSLVGADSQDDICPSCLHNVKFSSRLSEVHKYNRILTCQSLRDTDETQHQETRFELNLIDPTESCDQLSTVLLKTWDGDYDQYFAEKYNKEGGELPRTTEEVRPLKRKRRPSGDQVMTSTPARPDTAPLPFLSPISFPSPGALSPARLQPDHTDMSLSITPKPRTTAGKAKKRKSIMGF